MFASCPKPYSKPEKKRKKRPVKQVQMNRTKEEIEKLMKEAQSTRYVTQNYNS